MSRFPSSNISLYISAGVASVCLFAVVRSVQIQRKRNPAEHVVPSPLSTLVPKLSSEELYKVPYPPDLFPGGRDFDTPFGSIRIYEWGPENGRRVLLVHGISTPCLSLGSVAEKLAEQGCRVMLFDLFGRGYSDDPSDLPHDSRLYTSQILLAIASSPLAWTGTNGFAIIGYSLGGGIAASFTSTFPNLVSSLVLIAPSGLVRESHIAWQSKVLYSTEGILPEPLIHALVRKRMSSSSTAHAEVKTEPEAALAAETEQVDSAPLPLFPHHPLVSVAAAVQWQLDNHMGFIPAFISSIRHAPIMGQQPYWARIGARLAAQKANSADMSAQNDGLWRSKALLVLGRTDSVIIRSEVEADATACLGRGNLETVVIEAGHDVPVSKAREVANAILRFWGEDVDALDVLPEVEEETGT